MGESDLRPLLPDSERPVASGEFFPQSIDSGPLPFRPARTDHHRQTWDDARSHVVIARHQRPIDADADPPDGWDDEHIEPFDWE